jgi:hypothetical protein
MRILKGVVFSFYITLIVFIVWVGFIRNAAVFKYRDSINHSVLLAQMEDLKKGNQDTAWRREMYEMVGYNEMVLYFWRSFPSFYSDMCFIDPSRAKDDCHPKREL